MIKRMTIYKHNLLIHNHFRKNAKFFILFYHNIKKYPNEFIYKTSVKNKKPYKLVKKRKSLVITQDKIKSELGIDPTVFYKICSLCHRDLLISSSTPSEILFLTILRLKKYYTFFDLAKYFNISKSSAEILYKKGIISISTRCRTISFNLKICSIIKVIICSNTLLAQLIVHILIEIEFIQEVAQSIDQIKDIP